MKVPADQRLLLAVGGAALVGLAVAGALRLTFGKPRGVDNGVRARMRFVARRLASIALASL